MPQLRALARLGTMVAVAEELGYTPGAVSQQIAALEKSVSTPLIGKVGRRVTHTDAEVVLAEHAETILDAEHAAIDAVLSLRHYVAAPVLLGVFGSTAAALLPAVVARAEADYPLLRSRELDIDDPLDSVARGRVDVAFGLDYPTVPLPRVDGVEILTSHQERYGLALSPGPMGSGLKPRSIWRTPPTGIGFCRQPTPTTAKLSEPPAGNKVSNQGPPTRSSTPRRH